MNVHVTLFAYFRQNSNTLFGTQLEIQNSSQQSVIRVINFEYGIRITRELFEFTSLSSIIIQWKAVNIQYCH